MGHVSVIVISHDAIEDIEKDPNFGTNLVQAIHENYMTQKQESFSAGHGTAGWVVVQQHVDLPLEVRACGRIHKFS